MKRFILLIGDRYYPAGWEDFAGSFDTIEDARAKAPTVPSGGSKWYEIIDTETESKVEECCIESEWELEAIKRNDELAKEAAEIQETLERMEKNIEKLKSGDMDFRSWSFT